MLASHASHASHAGDVIDFVARARALQPVLRERAAEGDRLRRIPDATISDFKQAGFFRMLQPARWGGYEVDPKVFFDVQMTVAEACPSSAWVLGVVGVHNWQMALFPLAAQEEVWAADTNVLVSSSYAPTGKIERTEGGYLIGGRWSFSSGCDHCDWAFLGGFVPPDPTRENSRPDMRTFLIPKAQYTIDDTWFTAGLKATGSKDILVDKVFVPEHRTHRLADGYKRQSPGNSVNPAPLYRLPFGQIFVRSVSTTAIGCAEGALNVFVEGASRRIAASDKTKIADDPTTQMAIAHAASLLDEVKLVLYRNMDEMMALARAGSDISVERRVKFRYDSSSAVLKCMAAVDELFSSSGGRASFESSPILRYFLDIHAARGHYANNPDKPGRNFGGVLLGQNNQDYFI